jgi:peroxiredoxin
LWPPRDHPAAWDAVKLKMYMAAGGRRLGRGDSAPDFRLKRHDSGEFSLTESLARGPVLVAFYKVSCPTCQYTFPYLERMAGQNGILFVGISQDDEQGTQEFREDFGITFPSLLDSRHLGYPVSNKFGITHVPTLYLIDQDGRISWDSQGFSKADLEQLGERAGVKPFREAESVPSFKAG